MLTFNKKNQFISSLLIFMLIILANGITAYILDYFKYTNATSLERKLSYIARPNFKEVLTFSIIIVGIIVLFYCVIFYTILKGKNFKIYYLGLFCLGIYWVVATFFSSFVRSFDEILTIQYFIRIFILGWSCFFIPYINKFST